MKDKSPKKVPDKDRTWLEQEDPEIFYILRAMERDEGAFRWLQTKGQGLYLFARAALHRANTSSRDRCSRGRRWALVNRSGRNVPFSAFGAGVSTGCNAASPTSPRSASSSTRRSAPARRR